MVRGGDKWDTDAAPGGRAIRPANAGRRRRSGRGQRPALSRFRRRAAGPARRFTGGDVPVDAPTLVELDAPGPDLALDHAGRLELEAALGDDGSQDVAADHCVLGEDVALHDLVLADHDRLSGPDRPFDGTLDTDRALGLAISDHAHPRADDRDHGIARRLRARVVFRHIAGTRRVVILPAEHELLRAA